MSNGIGCHYSPTAYGRQHHNAITARKWLRCKARCDIESFFNSSGASCSSASAKSIKNLVVACQCSSVALCGTRARFGRATFDNNEWFALGCKSKRCFQCFTVIHTFDICQTHASFVILSKPLQIIAYRYLRSITRRNSPSYANTGLPRIVKET